MKRACFLQVASFPDRSPKVSRHHFSCLQSSGFLSVAALAFLASTVLAPAQTGSDLPIPYASINREATNYFGPGRETSADIVDPEIKIGILVMLKGPRKAQGEALIQAAQMALEEEAPNALPGHRLALVVRDATGPWGRASGEIVRLIFDDQSVALITCADGNMAHLAEQVGNREGVPVLTLSSDSATTKINIPWLFRVVPDDAEQAQVIARNIYRERRLRRVLLVTERDHDGRVGGEAFQDAARKLRAPDPDHLEVSSSAVEIDSVVGRFNVQPPEAMVVWTGSEIAERLLERIWETKIHAPVYLCHKAAQESTRLRGIGPPGPREQESPKDADLWVAASRGNELSPLRKDFEWRYVARTGMLPTTGAFETYDAVRLVVIALRKAGPNRTRLRDRLARVSNFSGVSGTISFDGNGNDPPVLKIVRLQ